MPKNKPAPVLAPDPDPCLGAGDHPCVGPLPDGWCADCGLGPGTHESSEHHAGLPHSPGVGGSARSGGPAVARALRVRGLLDGIDRITPEGRALVERAAPVLAVVAFLVQVGQPWSRIRRAASRRAIVLDTTPGLM